MPDVSRWREAGAAARAAVLSGLFGLLAIRPWRLDFGVPYAYSGDGILYQAYAKGVLDHGWYWHNSNLGAPEGQQLFDFPGLNGDTLNVLLIKAIGLFSSDVATVVHVFFLLTFPLAGLAAYLVLRRLGLSTAASTVCAVLFALLPFHFVRGEGHLLLSAYYAVPLGAYLVLAVLADRPLVGPRRTTVATLAICAVIALASGTFYWSAFTIVLVGAAGLLRAGVTRSLRPLWQGGAVVAAIFALVLASLAPSLVYWASHGTNPEVGHRGPLESEDQGLKLAQLVLPMEQHRIGKLAELRQQYDDHFKRTEASVSTPLGVVASVGFIWLLAVSLLQLASPGRRIAPARHAQVAIAALLALLFAWTGGFATFVAVVEPQIRAWNRLSIFIGFFSLAAVGLLLDRALRALRSRRRGAMLVAALLGVVLVVGLLDQTSRSITLAYGAFRDEYRSDAAFMRAIDERLPEGASVFQLPYVPFPENPPVYGMADYDHLRGYLHSDDLRWSYGFVKGRRGDPSPRLVAQPTTQQLVQEVHESGYAGIYIDRRGYPDAAAQLERELAATLGGAPLVSENQHLSFFALTG